MDTSSSVASTPELSQAEVEMHAAGTGVNTPEPCPLCGQERAQEWLRAPDRLHGRRDKYVLLRCTTCRLSGSVVRPSPAKCTCIIRKRMTKLISAAGAKSATRWKIAGQHLDGIDSRARYSIWGAARACSWVLAERLLETLRD